ncbi:hypothetical protein ACHAQJ_009217 [Trichoderma viride]
MKASVISLLLAGLVAAQDFSGQPDCAIPCLKDAIPKAGCALTDTACQCKTSTQAELAGLAAPCLITKCSTSDLAKAQAAAAAACKKDVGGSSSASSAATTEPSSETSAPATTSGAATTEAATTAPPSTSAAETTAQTSASETTASETTAPASTGVASGGATIPTSGPSGPSGISNSTVSGERSVVTRTSTAFVGGGGAGGSKTSGAPASTTLAGSDATGPVAGVLGAVLAALMAL